MTNKKSHGKRKRTRNKFKRTHKKLTIRALLQRFEPGSKVHIHVDSAVHSGLPDKRFEGLTGTVIGQQGEKGVQVAVMHGHKPKTLLVHAAHLVQAKTSKEAIAA